MLSGDGHWHLVSRDRNRINIKVDDAIEVAEKLDN